MSKDFSSDSVISSDVKNDTTVDYSDDLANDNGFDLNSGNNDILHNEGVSTQGICIRESNEGESHSGQRITDVNPASLVNQQLENEFVANGGNGEDFKAPYAKGTMVFTGELDKPNTFSQAHGETPKENGHWYANPSDVVDLNAAEIKDNYAIPDKPTHISEYNLGEGTSFTVGEVQGHEGWGEGGGRQYNINESDNKDLVETHSLSIENEAVDNNIEAAENSEDKEQSTDYSQEEEITNDNNDDLSIEQIEQENESLLEPTTENNAVNNANTSSSDTSSSDTSSSDTSSDV